jgi:hypothetical protein
MAMIRELGMKSALVMAWTIIVSSLVIGGAVNYLMRLLV